MVRGNNSSFTVRRVGAIAIAGATAVALSACGAGRETQTDSKQSAVAGVNVDVDDLALRDLQIEFDSTEGYAAGADAALRVWIGNEGDQEVRLTGVTVRADEATAPDDLLGTVTFVSPAAQAAEAEAEAAESASEDASEEADEESTDETADAEETTEAPATPEEDPFEGETAIDVAIAPADYARLDHGVEGGDYLLLEDLTQDLPVGGSVWVTFTFSNGQEFGVELAIGQSLDAEDRSFYEPEEPAEH
ncbi:copper chaperone PCu(A)C [Glycomyces paridis]|uniref:Copper chaperone PCu(A)C n=1 Tax=Glycomyces paridis TaxID=2126555 RepID=A0A4S8PHU8_9ACTN|nr:copper chaperone PCu(A)C [Glycomyces paridis]THV27969.1 copper chaperone PCu(A)C [Glycomyces paridis]